MNNSKQAEKINKEILFLSNTKEMINNELK